MKDTKVTITIGIATYNGESFIKRATDLSLFGILKNYNLTNKSL